MQKLALLLSLVIGLFSNPAVCIAENQPETSTKVLKTQMSVEAKISKMTLRQKIGQMFVFGFVGNKSQGRLHKIIRDLKPGGLIIFKRNIRSAQQIRKLNHQSQLFSQKYAKTPLLIMVDQEGGNVTRIKTKPSPPSALSIGSTGDPKLSEGVGWHTGKILNTLGFNMNLAPVIDLSDPFEYNFIGNRSFGQDPDLVNMMASGFSSGLYRAGILPTVKHFPGHGGKVTDSHKGLPVKHDSLEDLMDSDMLPFKYTAESSIPYALMVAHLALPKVDPSGLPATFSKKIVTDILINKIGYKGLIITDDIEMKGARHIGSIGRRTLKAIEAGNDMIMIGWNPKSQYRAVKAVTKAVKDGIIDEERINTSVRKILTTKTVVSLRGLKKPPSNRELKLTLSKQISDLRLATNKVSLKNLELSLRGYSYLRKTIDKNRRVFVFSADSAFSRSFNSVSPKQTRMVPLSRRQKRSPVEAYLRKNPKAIGVYYASGKGTAKKLNTLSSKVKRRLLVVNSTHPGVIRNTASYLAVVNINSRNFRSGSWIAKFLLQYNNDPMAPKKPLDLRNPASKKASSMWRPYENMRFGDKRISKLGLRINSTSPIQGEPEPVEFSFDISEPDPW